MQSLQEIVDRADSNTSPLIAVVAGSGQVARASIEGGVDIIVALNAGLFRTSGVGSLASFLPYGNANDHTERLLKEQLLPRRLDVPVVAGVLCHDPTQPLVNRLRSLTSIGVQGITNWPALGFWEGNIRQALESEGYGLECEIQMLKLAKRLGFVTFGFALTDEDAYEFARSGVDAMILNVGLTKEIENTTEKVNQVHLAVSRARKMRSAVSRSGRRPACLVFGGSITSASDFEKILRQVDLHGYAGGSSFERIPVSNIVTSKVKTFKNLRRSAGHHLPSLGALIGSSPCMQALFEKIENIAPYDVNVSIYGSSGTGKELVANQIHAMSKRRDQPFVTMNCGAIPDSLVESEFFGFEKGAFTGATQKRLGKFELANYGTLFLDEVEDLSPHAQAALLRVIQQGEITRIGGQKMVSVDVRILSASNKDLPQLVREGKFREDLYYRLNTVELDVPPLRSRREDIPLLVENFLEHIAARLEIRVDGLTPDFYDRLAAHSWPGNVRELEHVIIRSALMEKSPMLAGKHFDPMEGIGESPRRLDYSPGEAREHMGKLRYRRAVATLESVGGNKSRAAERLGISRKTLYEWLKQGNDS